MAIRIPIIMADGARVKTLEELREHFDLATVLAYYKDGRLTKWLQSGYYDTEADKIATLDSATDNFIQNLCEILGVSYYETDVDQAGLENAAKKNERRERLKKYTTDDAILEAIDSVAFTQEEMLELLSRGLKVIYLLGDRFALPCMDGITYVGINNPEIFVPMEFSEDNCIDVEYVGAGATHPSETTSTICHARIHTCDIPVDFWKKAAEAGNAIAEYELADAYYLGIGVDENNDEAYKWYFRAAEHGNAHAQIFVGTSFYNESEPESLNNKKAVTWFSKAAEQGNAEAQYLLGHCYSDGCGVDCSDEKAFAWFSRAAENGYVEAQYELGKFYYTGCGIKQSTEKAFECFLKAAAEESGVQYDAMQQAYSIGKCFFDGDGIEQDFRKAFECFLKIAELGDADAQHQLGICYQNGFGVEENKEESIRWFQMEANQFPEDKREEMLQTHPETFPLSKVLLYAIKGQENLRSIRLSMGPFSITEIDVYNRHIVDEDVLRLREGTLTEIKAKYSVEFVEAKATIGNVAKAAFSLIGDTIKMKLFDEPPSLDGLIEEVEVDRGCGTICLWAIDDVDIADLKKAFPDQIST